MENKKEQIRREIEANKEKYERVTGLDLTEINRTYNLSNKKNANK